MFVHSPIFHLKNGVQVHARDVEAILMPILTESRRKRIQDVSSLRCFDISVALEGLYDRGNISAVIRTGEGLGFSSFHVIETKEKFKEANRVTQGADKWVHIEKWKSTQDFIIQMRQQKKQILVTALSDKAKPLSEIDFLKPSVIVLGSEKEGVSDEILAAADEVIVIPMAGFVQSFNISVAGALCLYHAHDFRRRQRGFNEDVTEDQKQILRARYAYETLDSAEDILCRHFSEITKGDAHANKE
jgi:tRNA (guanosine-2'-O-)-methyltransferase